jgi:hypothetical protein
LRIPETALMIAKGRRKELPIVKIGVYGWEGSEERYGKKADLPEK